MTYDPNRPITPDPSAGQPYRPVAPEAGPVPTSPVAPAPVTAAAPAVVTTRKRSSSGSVLNIVLVVAAAVAIGGVAFAVGRTTAPASANAAGNGTGRFGNGTGAFPGGSFAPRASGQPGANRGGFGGGGFGGGVTITGTVESVDGDTLTVKTANGQTIQVTTGDSTKYNTEAPATSADVQAGKTVQVQLDLSGGGVSFNRPNASGAPTGPVGTAGSVTVVP